jgi:hypothetical protein
MTAEQYGNPSTDEGLEQTASYPVKRGRSAAQSKSTASVTEHVVKTIVISPYTIKRMTVSPLRIKYNIKVEARRRENRTQNLTRMILRTSEHA